MAPRVVRAMLTITALFLSLLLASHLPPLPASAAAASSPAPTPAPAPAPAPAPGNHRPPLHHVPPSGSNDTDPRRRPLRPPGHPRGGRARHPNPAPTVTTPSAWWRRLNFGERFGVALAGVAVAMQVAVAAFLLALRARHRQRRRAAAATGKAAEPEEEETAPHAAAAAASRPAPA